MPVSRMATIQPPSQRKCATTPPCANARYALGEHRRRQIVDLYRSNFRQRGNRLQIRFVDFERQVGDVSEGPWGTGICPRQATDDGCLCAGDRRPLHERLGRAQRRLGRNRHVEPDDDPDGSARTRDVRDAGRDRRRGRAPNDLCARRGAGAEECKDGNRAETGRPPTRRFVIMFRTSFPSIGARLRAASCRRAD